MDNKDEGLRVWLSGRVEVECLSGMCKADRQHCRNEVWVRGNITVAVRKKTESRYIPEVE